MKNQYNAYNKITMKSESPRLTEAMAFIGVSKEMQSIIDNNQIDKIDYIVERNMQLWKFIIENILDNATPLPFEIKKNMVNIFAFIINRTIELNITPDLNGLKSLININRNIAAGLMNN